MLVVENKKGAEGALFKSIAMQLLFTKHTETLVELVNTTTSINNFLSTSVEWVTCTTYVQV